MKNKIVILLFLSCVSGNLSAADVKHVYGDWYIDYSYYGEKSGSVVSVLLTNLEDKKYKATVDCDRKVVISGGTYTAESGPMWNGILKEVCGSWKFW